MTGFSLPGDPSCRSTAKSRLISEPTGWASHEQGPPARGDAHPPLEKGPILSHSGYFGTHQHTGTVTSPPAGCTTLRRNIYKYLNEFPPDGRGAKILLLSSHTRRGLLPSHTLRTHHPKVGLRCGLFLLHSTTSTHQATDGYTKNAVRRGAEEAIAADRTNLNRNWPPTHPSEAWTPSSHQLAAPVRIKLNVTGWPPPVYPILYLISSRPSPRSSSSGLGRAFFFSPSLFLFLIIFLRAPETSRVFAPCSKCVAARQVQ